MFNFHDSVDAKLTKLAANLGLKPVVLDAAFYAPNIWRMVRTAIIVLGITNGRLNKGLFLGITNGRLIKGLFLGITNGRMFRFIFPHCHF